MASAEENGRWKVEDGGWLKVRHYSVAKESTPQGGMTREPVGIAPGRRPRDKLEPRSGRYPTWRCFRARDVL